MDERVMLRIGTASLALGLVIAVIFEALHPARENPNDDPQVFAEYAQSGDWITIHLGQLAGALLLIVGLGALSGGSLALGLAGVGGLGPTGHRNGSRCGRGIRCSPGGRRRRPETCRGRVGGRASRGPDRGLRGSADRAMD